MHVEPTPQWIRKTRSTAEWLCSFLTIVASRVNPATASIGGFAVGGAVTSMLSVIIASWTIRAFVSHGVHQIEEDKKQRGVRMVLPPRYISSFDESLYKVISSVQKCKVDARVDTIARCSILGKASKEPNAKFLVRIRPWKEEQVFGPDFSKDGLYCSINEQGIVAFGTAFKFKVFWENKQEPIQSDIKIYAARFVAGQLKVRTRVKGKNNSYQENEEDYGGKYAFYYQVDVSREQDQELKRGINGFIDSVTHIRGINVKPGKPLSDGTELRLDQIALKSELMEKIRHAIFLGNCIQEETGSIDIACTLIPYSPVRHTRASTEKDEIVYRRFCQVMQTENKYNQLLIPNAEDTQVN